MEKTVTITIRLSNNEYNKIINSAKVARRPISNFITHSILKVIDNSYFVDDFEMDQIFQDDKLQKKLKAGHLDRLNMRGSFVE